MVFLVQNNGYAISVPLTQQTAAPSLAHKAVGYGMPGRLVDGNDAPAVHAVLTEAVERARSGGGPTLVEALTYRLEAHTNADDATRYREDAEVDGLARARPDRCCWSASCATAGCWTTPWWRTPSSRASSWPPGCAREFHAEPELDPTSLFRHVYAEPTAATSRAGSTVARRARQRRRGSMSTLTQPQTTADRGRHPDQHDGPGAQRRRCATRCARTRASHLLGEDVGALGGVFRITDGLTAEFGADRCLDTPLAEAGILGTAIGMAMYGLRPVVEMQFDAFAYPAMEQLVSHVAKMRNRTARPAAAADHHPDPLRRRDRRRRAPQRLLRGVLRRHTPGLHVVTPATVSDAYGLLRASIASDDPVVFLEPKRLYWSKAELDVAAAVDRRSAAPRCCAGPAARRS